ncbi:hypothetical protein [Salirhabdus sp. Marseille-P4669]|uniref:hypothetical protein n=1 Tax=Salirhabdus sp. Marseille-P4669 TaxID=2042310 RepID=UPI00135A690C|nr:hypothetical protein [Salirhabdus sp. Marseille-P4669]
MGWLIIIVPLLIFIVIGLYIDKKNKKRNVDDKVNHSPHNDSLNRVERYKDMNRGNY